MYAIGIDYGTESGRVLLLDLATGREVKKVVVPYRHGVIDKCLPEDDVTLPPEWALQHPEDWVEVVMEGIPEILRASQVDATAVVSIGTDFTSCTVLPATSDGTPLCLLSKWRHEPHAWPKLWKHHAAQEAADRMNRVAQELGEEFIDRYGGYISSEWYFPKLLQVFEENRAVYEACDVFVEAADWIVWYLTGQLRRNTCTAGFKATWSESKGIPSSSYFETVNPEFAHPQEKLGDEFYPIGTRAGTLRPSLAESLGLKATVAVTAGIIDAHASMAGAGVGEPGKLVMVMGTSTCHLTVTREEIRLPGITGVVKDGVLPGFYGYEAGQAAVGDMFAWFVKRAVPASYTAEANRRHVSVYEYLESLAVQLRPGQNGLIALDWWNGNRSILGDLELPGLLAGLTLSTTPAEIYRALLESTAFGTRKIVENFRMHGVPIHELVACGGLARRSPLLMQIYADVCGSRVLVLDSDEVGARGSALLGAVAAGQKAGGFATVAEACDALRPPIESIYTPNPQANAVYSQLYEVYSSLHDLLGRENVDVLHALAGIRRGFGDHKSPVDEA